MDNIVNASESNNISESVETVSKAVKDIQGNKTRTVAKRVDTPKVIEYFVQSINIEENYTLDEYKKLITAAFKEAAKKTKKTSKSNDDDVVVKREPTKYNIFVKEEIVKLKVENPEKQYKDLMKMAADKWNENKLII